MSVYSASCDNNTMYQKKRYSYTSYSQRPHPLGLCSPHPVTVRPRTDKRYSYTSYSQRPHPSCQCTPHPVTIIPCTKKKRYSYTSYSQRPHPSSQCTPHPVTIIPCTKKKGTLTLVTVNGHTPHVSVLRIL